MAKSIPPAIRRVPIDFDTDLGVRFGQKLKATGEIIVAHSTSSSLLPAILREGLRINSSSVWDNSTPGRLYFEIDPTKTYYGDNVYGWKATQKYGGDVVTLYVKVKAADLHVDRDDSKLGPSYRKNQKEYYANVPPENILGARFLHIDIAPKDFVEFAIMRDDRDYLKGEMARGGRLVRINRFSGYKGMDRIGREAKRRNAQAGDAEPFIRDMPEVYVQIPELNNELHRIWNFYVQKAGGSKGYVGTRLPEDDEEILNFSVQTSPGNFHEYQYDSFKNPMFLADRVTPLYAGTQKNQKTSAVFSTFDTPPTNTLRMTNLLIGDAFFTQNPEKILGVQTIERGQFPGSTRIVVTGTAEDVKKIDVPAVFVPQRQVEPTANLSTVPSSEVIKAVIENDFKEKNEQTVQRRRGKSVVAATSSVDQDAYTFQEIHEMYNTHISDDELEAYYFCHPELNYRLLFPEFTNTREDLIAKKLICFHKGKWEYYYSYVSGQIEFKLRDLEVDRPKIEAMVGVDQYELQLSMLQSVRPVAKKLDGPEPILLLPHANFCREYSISELEDFDMPYARTLTDAFKFWLTKIPTYRFDRTTYREIIDVYLDNKEEPVPKGASKAEKDRIERINISKKQRSKAEGDTLFAEFLTTAVPYEDRKAIEQIWNAKYNSMVEPNLDKIPVCFRMSRTFKNAPFYLNATQRQSAAFLMEKQSGLLAYGVGVGKTGAGIINFSQAYYNNLATKGLFVVPTNTKTKWIGEIQGVCPDKGGAFIHGILPESIFPKIVDLDNLNDEAVQVIKNYSDDDLLRIETVAAAKEYLLDRDKGQSGISEEEKRDLLNMLSGLNFAGLKADYDSIDGRRITYRQFVKRYLAEEQRELYYSLGSIKDFPDGTIFITTENGLQKFGLTDEESDQMVGEMYTILSQGDLSGDGEDKRAASKLQERIEATVGRAQKGSRVLIKDLGINWVCFDEAHYYKKLFTFVKGKAIGEKTGRDGIKKPVREKAKYKLTSGATPSARALAAYVMSFYVQHNNNNRNVVMLTATPFTNSPLEVYSMLTLTNYKALEEAGFSSMVDFFDTFMKINYEIKLTAAKKVEKKEVLTGYNNLPQLRQVIYSMMDKKDEGANLIRPVLHTWPSKELGIDTAIPMTSEQMDLMAKVKEFVKGKISREELNQFVLMDESTAEDYEVLDTESLIAVWEERMDRDFDRASMGDEISDTKREEMIAQMRRLDKNDNSFEESEMSVEEKKGVRMLQGLNYMRALTLSPYMVNKSINTRLGQVNVLPDYIDFVESSPKLLYTIGCIKSVIDSHRRSGTRVSGQVIYIGQGTEFFPLIKKYLMEKVGLTDRQVVIVTGKTGKAARDNAKRAFLDGEALIMIGSSAISIGIDLQDNSTVLYNLWFDWNPTDKSQIEGRIWRQGNRFGNVRVVYPVCYNSSDPVIFQYLYEKSERINDIWKRDSKANEFDTRDFDPKVLQKALVTDPEERAEWEILEQTEELTGKALYYENRRDLIVNAVSYYESAKNSRPRVIDILNRIVNYDRNRRREEAVQAYKDRIADIAEKFADKPDRLTKELDKLKETRYDHAADPEGRYAEVDYATATDAKIMEDAEKYRKVFNEISNHRIKYQTDSEEAKRWGRLGFEATRYADECKTYLDAVNKSAKALTDVIIPMGWKSWSEMNDPLAQFDQKIVEINEQVNRIEASMPELIEKYRLQAIEEAYMRKTIPERVAEFAAWSERTDPNSPDGATLLEAQLPTAEAQRIAYEATTICEVVGRGKSATYKIVAPPKPEPKTIIPPKREAKKVVTVKPEPTPAPAPATVAKPEAPAAPAPEPAPAPKVEKKVVVLVENKDGGGYKGLDVKNSLIVASEDATRVPESKVEGLKHWLKGYADAFAISNPKKNYLFKIVEADNQSSVLHEVTGERPAPDPEPTPPAPAPVPAPPVKVVSNKKMLTAKIDAYKEALKYAPTPADKKLLKAKIDAYKEALKYAKD